VRLFVRGPQWLVYVCCSCCHVRLACCTGESAGQVRLPLLLWLRLVSYMHLKGCTRTTPLRRTACKPSLGAALILLPPAKIMHATPCFIHRLT
jgi:hypothetical protein